MSNLLEKALLTAFGIFLLISFISLVFPFLEEISNYNESNINAYSKIIEEIDTGINFIIGNPNETYEIEVDYPENFNITINGIYIKYEYILDTKKSNRIFQYEESLFSHIYSDLIPQIYKLKILYFSDLIEVLFV